MNQDIIQKLASVEGFDWDSANIDKNWISHKVSCNESEEVFFNDPLVVQNDEAHSEVEKRYFVLGATDMGRKLFLVFTIRNNRIRVISVRDMSKKEKRIFDEKDTEI